MRTQEVLQHRPDCVVTLDASGNIVTKSFTGPDLALQASNAQREFDRLRRFGAALEGVAGAACPEVLELVPGPPPEVRMARAAGTPLLAVLRRRTLDEESRRRLAATMAEGVAVYVAEFGEPYWDFQFGNVLYDENAATLTFLDFGIPPFSGMSPPQRSPLAITLGNLIGSTIFQSTRPKWLWRIGQQRQAIALCSEVTRRAVPRDDPTWQMSELAQAANAAFRRSADQGPWYRRLWFRLAARTFARRVSVDGVSFTALSA